MTASDAMKWMKAHRWWIALVLIVIAGYSVGKDLALGDSAREAAARTKR